jgi:ribosome-associated protein
VRPLTLARRIARLTHTKKAFDVVIMNLKKLTAMTDYFVICSADSDIQVKAISDAVEEGMKQEGVGVWHREAGSANWILLDYVDVVLHVFHKNTRSFYSLERLWGDAEIVRVDEGKKIEKKSERKSEKKSPAKRRTSVRKKVS